MVLRDLIRDVFQTLWTHKLRTALTMFGIAWGVISIVLMVAAGEGLRQGQAKVAQNFGKDLMIIFAGRTSLQAGGARAGRRVEFEDTEIRDLAEQSPDCQWILPEVGQDRIRIHSNYNASAQMVAGSYPPFADIRSIDVGEGRFYDWNDVAEGRRVAFLGTEVKKQLFRRQERDRREHLSQRHSVPGHRRDEGQGPGLKLRRFRRQQNLHTLHGDPQ